MNSLFHFENDVVYAPGMTCVYDQLFDGLFHQRWKAYPFRKQELGFELYADPVTVIENLFCGETKMSAQLFAEPERFLAENGAVIEYDVLAIESRWLSYREHLFDDLDWGDLASRLVQFHDRRVVFVDCHYPHFGYLQNIQLVRSLTQEELRHQRDWQTARQQFLEILARSHRFRYISVDALAAYDGYRTACMDQPDHYTPPFRETFKSLLTVDSEEKHFSNTRGFVTVEEAVAGHESEIELINGLGESFHDGDVILKLRIRVKSEDPLCCDNEMIATWIARTSGKIEWRRNFAVNSSRMIHPVLNLVDGTNNGIVLKSFDDLVKIATFGRYEFVLTR
jgi:hypothetical protein